MDKLLQSSYLLVDLGVIRENVRELCTELGSNVALIPVLKDNAYGLGAVPVARAICENPAIRCVAVSQAAEGLELREAGIGQEILVMGNPLPFQLEAAIRADLTLTCGRPGFLKELAETARALGVRARFQLKIDTGLHRIGIEPGELQDWVRDYRETERDLELTGVYSHFSDAENAEVRKAEFQLFDACLARLQEAGVPVPLRHMSASASTECFPQYHLDAVRCGRRLLMDRTENPVGNIREAASWRCYITGIRPRKKGDRLGYGGAVELEKDAVVATVSAGYGDGLHRRMGQVGAPVLIGGRRCRILSCCMDQCQVDVSGVDCQVGDVVTFFGYDEAGNFLASQEVAAMVNNYEGCGLTSALSARVARVYTK